jgi:hypothetical protein
MTTIGVLPGHHIVNHLRVQKLKGAPQETEVACVVIQLDLLVRITNQVVTLVRVELEAAVAVTPHAKVTQTKITHFILGII